jgi:hypothetical protein
MYGKPAPILVYGGTGADVSGRRAAGRSSGVTESAPLPEPDQPADIHPNEERPDVADAAEDDTTVPGLPVPEGEPDELTPRFQEPS